jgi:NAD(P)-dependent dehydrogenase (short-subunit alcohol dehydrogenase family)
VFGPAEAFTPEQLAELYDVNVLSTQRVNRAALPSCANRGMGSWYGCQAAVARAERRPIWHPTFAAKAGMDAWQWSTRAS